MEFRALLADEIECRVQSFDNAHGVKGTWAMLLVYKDARCDMNILDETVGPLGWKREHSRDNANCTVSIWSEAINQWVSKEDTGTESNSDASKGLASDSFKRACFNWGIGRELYTRIPIFITLKEGELKEYKGKIFLMKKLKFNVSELTVKEKKITHLAIVDQNGNQRFTWNA